MGLRPENKDIAKKANALVHIQTAIDLLHGIGTQDTLNAWRYLRSARKALAEDVWRDSRHEME